jgi:hypothetical protein
MSKKSFIKLGPVGAQPYYKNISINLKFYFILSPSMKQQMVNYGNKKFKNKSSFYGQEKSYLNLNNQ